MEATWTTEQILGLAQDQLLAKAGAALANPDKWQALGRSDGIAWGQFRNRIPFQTYVILPELAFGCTCRARRAPCRHALALMLLVAEAPAQLPAAPLPAWAANVRQSHQQGQHSRPTSHPTADAGTDAKRLAQVKTSMQALSLWLRDLIRDGLAGLPARPQSTWQEMINAVVNGRAADIAHDLRTLSTLPETDDAWPETMLPQLGRLYLLTQGFERYDSLPTAVQSDLRMAVGWIPTRPSPTGTTMRDQWLVLGRRYKKINKQSLQRTWLWGLSTDRPALLQHVIRHATIAHSPLVTGSVVDATLSFHPGSVPLAAAVSSIHATLGTHGRLPHHHQHIASAFARHGRALAANPWLRQFPFVLQDVVLYRSDNRWWIRDAANDQLPLPATFKFGWHLLAISGGGPLTLFGEWHNDELHPLSARVNGRWLDLHIFRGGKA